MNNEEKKPTQGEEVTTTATSAASEKGSTSGFGGWWKSLATGAKAGLIAGVSCFVIAVVVLVVVLLGGKGPDGPDGPGGGGNGGGDGETVSYTVSVITKGGMPLATLPVYIHEYEDGALGEMIDDGYGATDETGKVTFKLPKDGMYAAKIDGGIPDGYDVEAFYPLVSTDLKITVSSAIIPETSLIGVSYDLGSVMHDFTVNSTVLVKDKDGKLKFEEQVFTLSEALKEKDAVLINFWYVNCSACQLEFPYMQSVYEDYSDDIAIIALNPYATDTELDVKDFQASYGLTFNVAKDNNGIGSAFDVYYYPTSVMVDRYGVVTLIHEGAITGERPFGLMFDAFIGDNYEQKLVSDINQLVPKEKPNIQMPSSDEIASAFEKDAIEGTEYKPYPDSASVDEKEYSWPFLAGKFGEGEAAVDCIYPSNAKKEASFAQLIFEVTLEAGDALAFDYYSSTELGADILYVVVDGKDIYSISGPYSQDMNDEQMEEAGANNTWATCYAFVAEEAGTYEVGLVYAKDSSNDFGDDTVYLKDLRIVTEAEIDSPTYIYRFAATNPNNFNEYQNYVDIFLGADRYYHVGSADGPILLADLMGYTRFSEDNSVYYMATDLNTDQKITEAEYDRIVKYCNYASNATIYGVSPVTPELKELLDKIVYYYGNPDNDKDWMKLCCYYDSYGTTEELEDPIKGLSLFSAYDVILSEEGDEIKFPNSFTYNRVIMPRGLLAKFTPTVSGTYLISSYAPDPKNEGYGLETDAWVFTAADFDSGVAWYTYENVDRQNTVDVNNCYMYLYLEAGKDYYIDIAFYDVYQVGTINFRVELIGDEGYYRFSQASPGPFTALESVTGELTETIIRGISIELDENGFWREKRTDGRLGSLIYVDFTQTTVAFPSNIIYSDDPNRIDMIESGGFNFKYSEEDLYVLNYLNKVGGNVEKCREDLKAALGDSYNATYTDYDSYGEPYTVNGFAVEEVLAGIYHGKGGDETAAMLEYASKIIKAGDTITVVSDDGTSTVEVVVEEGSPLIGCVAVDEGLANILQKFMDKYTFEGVENSWLKLCYYSHYFCAATPK